MSDYRKGNVLIASYIDINLKIMFEFCKGGMLMILNHGSNVEVKEPIIIKLIKVLDFGI